MKKKLAVTMGDPGGVGPEIVVRALHLLSGEKPFNALVVGDKDVIREAVSLLKLPLRVMVIDAPSSSLPADGTVEVIHVGNMGKFERNRPTEKGGRASAEYITRAVELASAREVDSIVTAPISKEALKLAGLKWPGHTEMLAELTGTRQYAMMLVGGPLRVILTTIHVPLVRVPALITREAVLGTIRLARTACSMLGLSDSRIGVAGLNPHAGESGIFGDEEIREILPAVEEARRDGISVSGPFPPDTIFHKAYKGDFDIVVCMYHDQGLIPLKMIAFERGVNVTVGLPFVRTSPDHGTAYDIAWKGAADPSSMVEAISLASRMRT